MVNLLKTDLKRIFKDKLFLVVCILGGAFALVTPLLYKLMFSGLEVEGDPLFASFVSAKGLFFSAFSPGSNYGLIVPVLLSIILCKDFSFGTVRNKLISGKSRTSVFLSMFLSCTIVMCAIVLLHALLTLGVSLLFFHYQSGGFTGGDFLYLLLSVFFELLVYVFISALVSFLCVFMKNVGLAVVMYVAVNMIFALIGSALMIGVEILSMEAGKEALVSVLEFFMNINIFTSTVIGTGTSYGGMDILYILLPTLGGTALFLALGILIFRKKDLK